MFGHPTQQHNCIAYVPQRSQVDWTFPVTVFDVVMMGRTRQVGLFKRPGAKDREVVRASLERVGALNLADKQIGELSGGQQQRVFIARSLALETELLLLDEPLTGLDVPSQDAIFEHLSQPPQRRRHRPHGNPRPHPSRRTLRPRHAPEQARRRPRHSRHRYHDGEPACSLRKGEQQGVDWWSE